MTLAMPAAQAMPTIDLWFANSHHVLTGGLPVPVHQCKNSIRLHSYQQHISFRPFTRSTHHSPEHWHIAVAEWTNRKWTDQPKNPKWRSVRFEHVWGARIRCVCAALICAPLTYTFRMLHCFVHVRVLCEWKIFFFYYEKKRWSIQICSVRNCLF